MKTNIMWFAERVPQINRGNERVELNLFTFAVIYRTGIKREEECGCLFFHFEIILYIAPLNIQKTRPTCPDLNSQCFNETRACVKIDNISLETQTLSSTYELYLEHDTRVTFLRCFPYNILRRER